MRPAKSRPHYFCLFGVLLIILIFENAEQPEMNRKPYCSPITELCLHIPGCLLASSFNDDNFTEYLDYEDGGML